MDLVVRCSRKAVKLNHSLTHSSFIFYVAHCPLIDIQMTSTEIVLAVVGVAEITKLHRILQAGSLEYHSISNHQWLHFSSLVSSGLHQRHPYDVIKWKHFLHYWYFVRGIHWSPVNSLHKGQWRGALIFSLIYALINGWVNSREAGDLRRHHAHYDVRAMILDPCYWPFVRGIIPFTKG